MTIEIDFEKSLLVVAGALRGDLEQEGADPMALKYVDADIAGRTRRIAQLEQTGVETENYILLPYTDAEKEILIADGAAVYLLEGQSIGSQRRGGRRFWSDWHEGHPIEDLTSRIYEVAIWPDPEKFFVPGTFNKSKPKQEELIRADGQKIQARLGIPMFTEILPGAPEGTEVMFRHFDKTGVRLLGENYMTKEKYWSYMRTNTPTDESGSDVAVVGSFRADYGPNVDRWYAREGLPNLGAARWGVKIKGLGN